MLPIMIDVRSFGNDAQQIRNDVFRIAASLGSMKEPLTDSINLVVIKSISMNFVMGGRPKWKELSDSRVAERASATPILMDREILFRAAKSRTIWNITDTEARMDRLDDRVPYAKFHQGGTRNMPQRQFAVLQPRDVDNIVEIFRNWIDKVAAEKGGW